MSAKPAFRQTFITQAEDLRGRIGQPFDVIADRLGHPDIDDEVGQMWRIRFADGFETDAFPEEVEL